MFKKINIIRNISPRSFLKKIQPFTFSNKKYDGGFTREQKYQINKSNKIYIKGVSRQRSVYDIKQMESDFEKSQKYKKNICKLPVINFHKIINKSKEDSNDRNKSIIKKTNFFDNTVFIRTKFLHENNNSQEKSRNLNNINDEKKNANTVNIKNVEAAKLDKEKNAAKTIPVEENNQNKDFWVTDLKDGKNKEEKQ